MTDDLVLIERPGGAFCSGRRVHRAVFNSDRIVIGALERAAVNGGAALALACDFRVRRLRY